MVTRFRKTSVDYTDDPIAILESNIDLHVTAESAFASTTVAVAIAGLFMEKHQDRYCAYYDTTLYTRHKHNGLPEGLALFHSLDELFDKCHIIVWSNLSYNSLDVSREMDTVLHRRYAAGLINIVSGWNPPPVLAGITDKKPAASLSNPYPLLHERAGDARCMCRIHLETK